MPFRGRNAPRPFFSREENKQPLHRVSRIARVVQHTHARFHVYLPGRDIDTVEDLVRAARGVQETLLATAEYRPPPPAAEALEPSCARPRINRATPTPRSPEREGTYAYTPRALNSLECTRDGVGRPGAASLAGVSESLNSRSREAPGTRDWSPQGPHLGGNSPRVPHNPERGRLQFSGGKSRLHDPRQDLQTAGRPQHQPEGGWQRGNDPAEPRGSQRRGSGRGNVGTQQQSNLCFNCGQRGHFLSHCPQRWPRKQRELQYQGKPTRPAALNWRSRRQRPLPAPGNVSRRQCFLLYVKYGLDRQGATGPDRPASKLSTFFSFY